MIDNKTCEIGFDTCAISCSCNCMQTVTTFGFRGEALSAMCALAELSIVTRTSSEGVWGVQGAGARV